MAVITPWTEPFLAYLTRQELPRTQTRHVALCDGLKPTRSTRASFIRKALPESFKGASPKRKDDNFWKKFMLDLAATTLQLGPL